MILQNSMAPCKKRDLCGKLVSEKLAVWEYISSIKSHKRREVPESKHALMGKIILVQSNMQSDLGRLDRVLICKLTLCCTICHR